MNDQTLRGFRSMASVVVQSGTWEVVVPNKFGVSVKMFDLTEERAKEYAKSYKGGVAREMKK